MREGEKKRKGKERKIDWQKETKLVIQKERKAER